MTPRYHRDTAPEDPGASAGELDVRLRRALHAEARTVTPGGDGLGLIRERVARSPRSLPWWQPVAGLAAAAAVVTVAVLALGGAPEEATTVSGRPAATGAVTPDRPSPTPGESTASQDPSVDASESTPNQGGTSSAAPGTPVTVPVYYLHDDTTGPKLYREYHRVPQLLGGKAPTAVQAMLSTPALDPDYTSLWAAQTKVLSYRRDGNVATVDLSADALAGEPAGTQAAALSLQQLVYTVTAAEGDGSLAVALTVEGEQVDELWGSAQADRPMPRGASLDVLGQAWLLTPVQGATVSSPVDLTVYGTAYEGHTVLRVFRPGAATPVVDTFVTTAMGEFSEATEAVELPAGRYVVRAYTEYGEQMALIERDSKEFTVD